jgi:hypothetical protein
MNELFADWLKNPVFWIGLLFLVGLYVLGWWVRLKFGRMPALGVALLVWATLVVATQLLDPKALADVRYWISGGVIMGATVAPALLFPLAFPADTRRGLLLMAGIACAVVGALAFPVVALYTVCALGIDCL